MNKTKQQTVEQTEETREIVKSEAEQKELRAAYDLQEERLARQGCPACS